MCVCAPTVIWSPLLDENICEFFFTLFLSMLSEGTPKSEGHRTVHSVVVGRLKELGPKYIAVMKRVMSADPKQKARLENALKATSMPATQKGLTAQRTTQPKAPAITLRQDFSNFKL